MPRIAKNMVTLQINGKISPFIRMPAAGISLLRVRQRKEYHRAAGFFD